MNYIMSIYNVCCYYCDGKLKSLYISQKPCIDVYKKSHMIPTTDNLKIRFFLSHFYTSFNTYLVHNQIS